MEKLKLKKYKKGDKMAGIYARFPITAGTSMYVASIYGIHADVFDRGKFYQVPNVQSENPGSGKFLDFLLALKYGLNKPVYFCTITNQHIYKYLEKAKIGVVIYDGKKPVFYNVSIKTDKEVIPATNT